MLGFMRLLFYLGTTLILLVFSLPPRRFKGFVLGVVDPHLPRPVEIPGMCGAQTVYTISRNLRFMHLVSIEGHYSYNGGLGNPPACQPFVRVALDAGTLRFDNLNSIIAIQISGFKAFRLSSVIGAPSSGIADSSTQTGMFTSRG